MDFALKLSKGFDESVIGVVAESPYGVVSTEHKLVHVALIEILLYTSAIERSNRRIPN